MVDRSVNVIGRPKFVGIVTIFIAAWLGLNLALLATGGAFDPPPFSYLETAATVAGVYFTLLILITQRRENQLSEHRDQLTLELAILSEQKSAKIIQLLEELRRDHPAIADRHDPEAAALSKPADTRSVSTAIGETHAELRG